MRNTAISASGSAVEHLLAKERVAGSIPVSRSTRLSLDAIRVPGSAFYFVSSLAFMVGYLFVNASQGVGDEIDVTPIFFSIHAGFRAF